MRQRNRLYTVNKWNKTLFLPENTFNWGGTAASWDKAAANAGYMHTDDYMNSKGGWFGLSKADNPFSKGNLMGTFSKEGLKDMAGGAAGQLLNMGANLVGGLANNAISGGLSSGAGSAISGIGSTVGGVVGSVNPVLGAGITVGSQVLGGVTNALFGESVNEQALKEANEGTAMLNNFKSNAATFDEIKGPEAVANVHDVYKGGLFNDVSDKNEELKEQRRQARMFVDRSIANNVFNLANDQMNNALANYSAYGGPLDFGGGALGLMQQNEYFNTIDRRTDAIAGKNNTAYTGGAKTFADGGLKAAFLDNFGSDPIGAAVRYNQGLEALAAQEEAKQIEAQKAAEYADMQKRLLSLETENQGLQAMVAAMPSTNPLPEIPEASSSTPSRATYNSNWDYIEDQLRRSGKFNDVQIEGIKYNLQRESAINPDAVGDNGSAFGLAQWHGSRKPKDMSIEGQTRHLIETLSNYDGKDHWIGKDNYEGFMNARTPEEAHYYITRGYERPAAYILNKVKRDSDMSLRRASSKEFAKGGKKRTYSEVRQEPDRKITIVQTAGGPDYFETIPTGGLDTLYTRYTPNGWFTQETNVSRKAGEPATPEYLQLQQEYRNALEGSTEGNIGFNMAKDFLKGTIGKETKKKISKGEPYVPHMRFAFGGELGTNGTDFTNGLLYIDEGGSHESNPMDGVPMGLDPEGIPNLVEEGETVYNDYVFSDRMQVPDFMLKDLGLPKSKKGISFADASKKLAQESEKRPNDPISQDGLQASLSRLAEIQETERMRKQAKEYQGLEGYACGGKIGNKYDKGGAMKWLKQNYPKTSPKVLESLGSALSSYIDKNPTSFYKSTGLSGGMSNEIDYGLAYNRLNNSGEDGFNAWVENGLDRRAAFALTHPMPNKPKNQDLMHDYNEKLNARNRAWARLVRDANKPASAEKRTATTPQKPVVSQTSMVDRDKYTDELNRRRAAYYASLSTPQASPQIPASNTATPTPVAPATTTTSTTLSTRGKRQAKNGVSSNGKYGGIHADAQTAGLPAETIGTEEEYLLDPYVEGWETQRGISTEPLEDVEDAGDMTDDQEYRLTPKPYDTRMRYAPVVGSGIMALTDALGLTNKPDYSGAASIEAAARGAGYVPNVTYDPIGDYMRYTPLDRQFHTNQLLAASRATDRALANNTSPSKAAAMIANGYNTTLGLGNLARQAEEYNRGIYERTKEFNRRTNMFNSQMGLEADMADARYHQAAQQMGLSGLAQAAALRNDIDARVSAARSANLTNLFNNLGNIGRENFAFNMVNSTRAANNGYGYDRRDGTVGHAAFGGKFKRRKK